MAKLYFEIGANYDDVYRLTQRLRELETQMMKTDAAADMDGLKALQKEYSAVAGDLQLLATQAAKSGADVEKLMGSMTQALAQNFKDMEDAIAGGAGVSGAAFQEAYDALVDQVGTAMTLIEQYSQAVTAAIADNSQELSGLITQQANSAQDIPELNEKIVALQRQDSLYRQLQDDLNQYKTDIMGEADALDSAKAQYDDLAEAQAQLLDQKEELEASGGIASPEMEAQLDDLANSMQNTISTFLNSGSSLESKLASLTPHLTRMASAFLQNKLSASAAAGSMNLFQAASLKAGTALVRMGMSAKAAKIALAGFSAALPVAAVTLIISLITKLISKWKEHKKELETQKQEMTDFFGDVGNAASKNIGTFLELKLEWDSLSGSMAKAKFLDERRKDFEKLGIAIGDVNDAEQVMTNGVDAYVEAQIRKASADLYAEKIREKIAQLASKRMEVENADTNKVGKVYSDRELRQQEYDVLMNELNDLRGEWKKQNDDVTKLMASLSPIGPMQATEKTLKEETANRKKEMEDAKSWYDTILANTDKYTLTQLQEAKQRYEEAKKKYEETSVTGVETGGGKAGDSEKKSVDTRAKLIEEFSKKVAALIGTAEDDITDAQIEAMQDGDKKIEAQQKRRLDSWMKKAEDIGAVMSELYAGNVDLLHRPQIDASNLNQKGWDAGEGTATVFSSGFEIDGKEMLVTPILPDGSVLSPEELGAYVDDVLGNANDILSADNPENGGKGIVIAVDVDEDAGERLHLMQEDYYELVSIIGKYIDLLNSLDHQDRMEKEREKENELYSSLVENYKSKEDKRLDIEADYLADSILLEKKYEETGDEQYNRALEERRKAYVQALDELEKDTSGLMFLDPTTLSKEGLVQALSLAEKEIKRMRETGAYTNDEMLQMVMHADELREELMNYDFSGIETSLGGIVQQMRKISQLADLIAQKKKNGEDVSSEEEYLKRLKEEFKKSGAATFLGETGNLLGKVGDTMATIADISNNQKLASLAESFSTAGTVLTGFVQSLASGDPTAMISSVINLFLQSLVKAAQLKQEWVEIAQAMSSLSLELESIANSKLISNYENAFGEDSYGKFQTYYEYYKKYGKLLTQFDELADNFQSTNRRGDYAAHGRATGNVRNESQALRDSMAFEFYDAEGNLRGDEIIAWYNALTEKQKDALTSAEKAAIEELIAYWDEYKTAVEGVKEYLSDIFDDIAGTLADEMIEKFISTGNAIVDMTDNLQDFKKQLASTIVQSMLLNEVFTKQAQDEIAEMLASGDVNGAIEAYNDLLNQANDYSGEIQKFLEGINIQDYVDQSATGGAFQTMSQDQASELNGRFTALQISGENIDNGVGVLISDFESFVERYSTQFVAIDDIRNIQAQSLIELQGINENTLAALKPIRNMETTITEIKKKVEKL